MNARVRVFAGAALAIAFIGGTAGVTLAKDNGHTLLRADSMVGVPKAYTGTLSPIRGINGGGAPWVIGDAEVRLRSSGRVDVDFEGLVIDPSFPAPIAGTNPVPNMKVTVSCLSTDAAGVANTVNVSSETFPVDAAGNGEARVHVDLPSPCIAPIVFVANGNAAGAWFAATGA